MGDEKSFKSLLEPLKESNSSSSTEVEYTEEYAREQAAFYNVSVEKFKEQLDKGWKPLVKFSHTVEKT